MATDLSIIVSTSTPVHPLLLIIIDDTKDHDALLLLISSHIWAIKDLPVVATGLN